MTWISHAVHGPWRSKICLLLEEKQTVLDLTTMNAKEIVDLVCCGLAENKELF